jgi:hypothetical protein
VLEDVDLELLDGAGRDGGQRRVTFVNFSNAMPLASASVGAAGFAVGAASGLGAAVVISIWTGGAWSSPSATA